MNGFLGGHTQQMRDFSETVRAGGGRLRDLGDALHRQAAGTTWEGADAVRFRAAVTAVQSRLRNEAAAALDDLAGQIETHAQEQDAAGDADGAGAGQEAGLPARAFGMGAPAGTADAVAAQASAAAPQRLPEDDDQAPLSAAERDARHLLDTFLPIGQNPHADQTESDVETINSRVRFPLDGQSGDPLFVDQGVNHYGETRAESTLSQESYVLPDGTTVAVVETTRRVAQAEGVDAEASGGAVEYGVDASGAVYAETTTYSEVSVPPGVDLPPDFNPHNVDTYPPGVQVRFDDRWIAGAEGQVDVSAGRGPHGVGVGFSGSHGEGEGESVIYERTDDGQVRVTQGPSEGFEQSRGFAVSYSAFDALNVGLDLTETEHRQTYEYESAMFDSSPEGSQALEAFRGSGEFPESGTAGTSDRASVVVGTSWHESATGLSISLGSAGDGPEGEFGSQLALRDSTTGFDSHIWVDYHEDNSSRYGQYYSDDPSTGVYSGFETISGGPQNAYEERFYLSAPVDGQFSESNFERDYGLEVEQGDRVDIDYTYEEVHDLWVAHSRTSLDNRETALNRSEVLEDILREPTVADSFTLQEHIRRLDADTQGSPEDVQPSGHATVKP